MTMMSTKNIGILAVGAYLPESVRRNDHWPAELVEKWRQKAANRLARTDDAFGGATSEGTRMVMAELRRLGDDPFQGLVERRTMPDGMSAADMETAAAREAIARWGGDARQIDLVLSYTMCPDFINVPTACVVHANLGLPERCLTMAVDAVCNSFIMQLTLAQSLIQSGRARYALLTQSSAITRMPMSGEHYDTWFGDAGTAVLVGPVDEGHGLLSVSHHTDGTLHKALVLGVPGKRWFDEGEVIAYSEDHRANFDMVAQISERAKQVLTESIAEAGLVPADIDFYACHQAFLWLRDVTQRYAGMTNARSVDTFKWAGTVSAANLPLVMAMGERDGLLRAGDRVAMFQGGTGMTWSALTMCWGG
jgi:3-oxoacyl-[acyl-carrier-protein] synthase-3